MQASSSTLIVIALVAACVFTAQADQPSPATAVVQPSSNYQINRKLVQELLDKDPTIYAEIMSGQLTPTSMPQGMQGMQQGMQGMQMGMQGMQGMNPAFMFGQAMNPMGNHYGMQRPNFPNFPQNRRYNQHMHQRQMQPMSMPGYEGAYPGLYGGMNGGMNGMQAPSMMQPRQNGPAYPQMMA